jgi:hypothetical protein
MDVMYDEEEVPNVMRMRIVEEEVSLSQPITAAVPQEKEEVSTAPLVMVLRDVMGCLVHIPAMVSSSPFFFPKNVGDSSRPFSHKCGRFVGLEPDLY